MTDAQIRFRQLEESKRHNTEQEKNWAGQLAESIRHDQEQERLSAYATETGAQTSKYSTDVGAQTSRYSTDVGGYTSVYRTDVESRDRQARLEFDQRTQDFKNQLARDQLELQRIDVESSAAYKSAQGRRMLNQTRMELVKLANEATRLGLEQEAAKYSNALNAIKAFESATRSMGNISSMLDGMYAKIFQEVKK